MCVRTNACVNGVIDDFLTDPLSEITRVGRRTSLLLSTLAVASRKCPATVTTILLFLRLGASSRRICRFKRRALLHVVVVVVAKTSRRIYSIFRAGLWIKEYTIYIYIYIRVFVRTYLQPKVLREAYILYTARARFRANNSVRSSWGGSEGGWWRSIRSNHGMHEQRVRGDAYGVEGSMCGGGKRLRGWVYIHTAAAAFGRSLRCRPIWNSNSRVPLIYIAFYFTSVSARTSASSSTHTPTHAQTNAHTQTHAHAHKTYVHSRTHVRCKRQRHTAADRKKEAVAF